MPPRIDDFSIGQHVTFAPTAGVVHENGVPAVWFAETNVDEEALRDLAPRHHARTPLDRLLQHRLHLTMQRGEKIMRFDRAPTQTPPSDTTLRRAGVKRGR